VKSFFITLFVGIILCSGIVFAVSLKVGDRIPEIVARDLEGKPVEMSRFKGKILIIDFWATWCVPCVKEFPSLEKFYRNNKDKGIELIAISVDNDIKRVRKFIKKHGYSFNIFHDFDHKTSRNFKIGLIPTLFIVGPDGKIKNEPVIGGKRHIDRFLEERIKSLFNK